MMGDVLDDDLPQADPAIRTNYEAAVGRLILAHNEVDYRLTTVIRFAIAKLGGDSGLHRLAGGMFAQRVDSLALLQAIPINLYLGKIDCAQLRELNEQRNIVAHGHFEQNPFDGSYNLIGKRKYATQQQWSERQFPAERLDELSGLLGNLADTLRYVEACFCFDGVEVEEPDHGDGKDTAAGSLA